MTRRKELSVRLTRSNWGLWFSKGYICFTAATLVLIAAVMLLAALEDWVLLRRSDALSGLTVRTVLVVASVLHLTVCACLFATRDLISCSLLLLWVGFNHIVYRVGLAWLKATTPLPILRVLGMKVGIHARTLDFWWKWFMAFLVVGSLLVLVFEWRRRKRLETEAFLVRWRKTRKQGENSPTA